MLRQIAFCVAVGSKLLALSLSTPVTLVHLEPKHVPANIQTAMNERGDAVVTWANQSSAEKALESAIKPNEGEWLPPTLVSNEKVGVCLQTVIDAEGNVGVLWQPDRKSHNLFLAEKKWMEPWSKTEEISFNYNNVKFTNVVMDRDRNLIALVEMPFGTGPAVALAFRDAKTHDIVYAEKGQADFSWSSEVFVDSRGAALAVWHSSHTKSGWFSSTTDRVFEGAWHEDHQPWSMPEQIFALPKSDTVGAIKIAVDAQRNAVILRVVGSGDNKHLQAFSRVNEKWLGPVEIAHVGKSMTDLNVCMDEKGNSLVIWRDMLKGAVHSVYKPFAQDWRSPMEILQEGRFRLPILTFDHAGNFVLIWSKMDEDSCVIQGAVFPAKEGAWSKPATISPDGYLCLFHSVAFSENGKGILAWAKALRKDAADFMVQVAEITVK